MRLDRIEEGTQEISQHREDGRSGMDPWLDMAPLVDHTYPLDLHMESCTQA